MKIFTNDGLRRIGDRTLEKEGIEMLDLIERAASAVSYELISRWRTSKRFVFFAGPGDNGADALAVARMMYEQGYRPEVYLFNIKSAKKYVNSKTQHTNADRILGQECVVTEQIDNLAGTGEITVGGKRWTARSADQSVIPKEACVVVERIEGVKAIVKIRDGSGR